MRSLVDYLTEKLTAAKVGCTCRTEREAWESRGLAPGTLMLTDCAEHGPTRWRIGGLTWVRT